MSPNSPAPSKGSLRGKMVAGSAVGLLALGIWIGTWLGDFGFGGRGAHDEAATDSTSDATDSTPADSPPGENVSVDLGPATTLGSRPSDQSVTEAPRTVAVMIYDDGYRLPDDPAAALQSLPSPASQAFSQATLEAVIARAEQATGNENGIKVLVLRHKTATVGALNRLLKALHEAGLRNEEMHQMSDFYD